MPVRLASIMKAPAPVAVDEAAIGGVVGMMKCDEALEDVGVLMVVLAGGVGTREFEQIAKFDDE